MIPPGLFDINIRDVHGKGFRFWFPFFLFWPFLYMLILILLPLTILAQLILSSIGIRPFSMLIGIMELFGSMRGMSVKVTSKNSGNINIIFK